MGIGNFKNAAIGVGKRIVSRMWQATAALARPYYVTDVLEQMQIAYAAVLEKPITTYEELIDHDRKAHEKNPPGNMPFNEELFHEMHARAFNKAEAIHCASSFMLGYGIAMREIEQYRGVDNGDVFFVTGADGARVTLNDIKALYDERQAKLRSIYLFNMMQEISRLTYHEQNAVYRLNSEHAFEAGETTYAYGIRMITNTIIFHAIDKNTGEFMRDKLIDDAGLKGKFNDRLIKRVLDDVQNAIWFRYETGRVLRPRHHRMTLVKSGDTPEPSQ